MWWIEEDGRNVEPYLLLTLLKALTWVVHCHLALHLQTPLVLEREEWEREHLPQMIHEQSDLGLESVLKALRALWMGLAVNLTLRALVVNHWEGLR